ncbi:hypothetical protein CLIM01_06198 [Colletotrichum limetticola]|uniref:Uncharacterized protein n=1 Tax=Colletotrichum limetticola TaxID=1209924 RepID=A0ABQ9PY58_9PEZI|nr:hypothetical protein CLIM01_06198 [Colletotrichum limetticola]
MSSMIQQAATHRLDTSVEVVGGSNPSARTQISGCSGKLSDKARIRVEQRLVDRALLSSPVSLSNDGTVHGMQESAVRSRMSSVPEGRRGEREGRFRSFVGELQSSMV